MTSRRIVVSNTASRRLAAARAWLASVDGGIVIGSTPGAADDLLRGLARSRGVLGVHRTTLGQLARELATPTLAARGLTPVSDVLGIEALAARCIHVVRSRHGLEYFTPVAQAPGFARALGRTLSELRRQRVAGPGLASMGEAGRDLELLLAAFAAELEARSLVDGAALFALAAEVAASGAHRFARRPLLLLDVALSTRAEIRLLSALGQHAPAILGTVPAGDVETREGFERELGSVVDDLDAGADGSESERQLDRLRRNVFSPEVSPGPTDPEDHSVQFSWAPGEGRECIEIARRILALARDGVPFDRIAVLVRTPATYQPLLEDAFARADIPGYFTHGTVRPDPAGRAFLAILACAAEGLSAWRFSEYLSLAQVPRLGREGKPKLKAVPWVEPSGAQMVFQSLLEVGDEADELAARAEDDSEVEDDSSPVVEGSLRTPAQWERLIVDAAVVGGRDRWQTRLEGLRRELELKLREASRTDADAGTFFSSQLERLAHLERFAMPVIDALVALPAAATWGMWLERLETLATLVLRRPHSVLAVLGELRPMAEVGPVGLDEVREVLLDRLTELRDEPPRRRYGRVLVARTEEVRGRSFEVVFLPGLAEGIFPRKASEDPLLLDGARVQVDQRLATQGQRTARERLLLRLAAGAAERALIVTYPRVDVAQGRSRVPSFYALDVLRAAEGRLPDLRELERRAGEACASPLGWPAPRDPQESLDDAEWDLAVLEPLLRPMATDITGRGRFLLDVNPSLARALRTRGRRWLSSWSEADGIVDPDDRVKALLAAELPTARAYSPTALQNFASCPYRFLLQAIHRLRPREEIIAIEQLDPLTRGSIFHEIQAEVLRELDRRKLLPVAREHIDEVMSIADRELDRVAAIQKDKLAPAIPRVWGSEIEGLRTDLRGWIRKVVDAGPRWRPAYFELAFGLGNEPGRDPRSRMDEVVLASGVHLRGSVDLVESDDERGVLRVTDHKTGKALGRSRVVLNGGETMQPLLYGLAVESVLARPVEVGQLFFCTQRGEYRVTEVVLDASARERGARALAIIASGIEQGFLPAAPKERACDWCDYRLVCGPHEELRYRNKRPRDPRMAGLVELRGME